MKTGGYVIIDLENVQIGSNAKTIRGVYDAVKNANRHAILLSGLNVEGMSYGDTFVNAHAGESKFTFVAHGIQIEVSSADEVKTVTFDGDGEIPITDRYNKFGLTKVIDTNNVIGGKSIRVVTSGSNIGAITINPLEKINELAPDADASAIVTAINTLLADLKAKTIMKS